jgi:hypothetical protein
MSYCLELICLKLNSTLSIFTAVGVYTINLFDPLINTALQ